MDPQLDLALLTFARDAKYRGEDPRQYRHAVNRGRMVRVHRGAYADASDWARLTETEQYIYQTLATATGNRHAPVVSHISAAALWGAPIIGPMPKFVHTLSTESAGTRTEHGVRKHASRDLDMHLEVRGELRMTDLPRTLVETAAESSFLTAVGVIDWALSHHLVTKQELLMCLDDLALRRGRRPAVRAIEFADGRAGSPGETLSRVRIHEFGFPPPELQVSFDDSEGLIGIVDFFWRQHRLIGEFDGVAKYIREEITQGRTAAEIVVDEKMRENRLRATGPKVSRWDWAIAWPQYGLYAHLLKAGLPSSLRGPV